MSKFKKFKLKLANALVGRNIFSLSQPGQINNAGNNTSSSGTAQIAGIATRIGYRTGDTTSRDFEDPEYDFTIIQTAYEKDSYIRQGIDKYVDQIFKEGWKFYGSNQDAVTYIKKRFSYMSRTTSTPTLVFLTEIAENIVKYSNCIIAKSRSNDPAAFPQGVTVTGLDGGDAIAGYYVMNIPSMQAKRDEVGTILGWRQHMESAGKDLDYKPEDIIHMYYKREAGNCFGTPFLWPVIDDIKALRQMEENVSKMVYRNIYPFFHIAIGTDEMPVKIGEVEEIKDKIENGDVESMLVTDHRVKVNTVDSNKVIDAQHYLEHYENRGFSGIGIPPVLFGRGGTANRSTGDNMSDEMSDRVKAFQSIIEAFINDFIIIDLLLEGGYDPFLNEEDNVYFAFNQNEVDVKIKKENHAVFMFTSGAITETEMREEIGRDPIEDRSTMYNTLYGQKDTSSQASNLETPENQYGKKTSPKKTTNSDKNTNITKLNNTLGMLEDFKLECTNNITNCKYTDNREKVIYNTQQVEELYIKCKYIVEKNNINCNNIYSSCVNNSFNTLINTIKRIDDYKNIEYYNNLVNTSICMFIDKVKNINMEKT